MASNYLDSYKQTLVADFELQKQLNPALSVPAYIEARKRRQASASIFSLDDVGMYISSDDYDR